MIHIAELVKTNGILKQNLIYDHLAEALVHSNVRASHLSNNFNFDFILLKGVHNFIFPSIFIKVYNFIYFKDYVLIFNIDIK